MVTAFQLNEEMRLFGGVWLYQRLGCLKQNKVRPCECDRDPSHNHFTPHPSSHTTYKLLLEDDKRSRSSSSSSNTSDESVSSIFIMNRAFVDVVNRFGIQLQSLTLDPDKSTGICPTNIYHCLSMVAAGSKDENLAAFGQTLSFDVDALNETLQKTVKVDTYCKTNSAVDFSTASSIWHPKDFILEKAWLERMQTTFNTTIGPLELQPINDFIFRETKGKFKNLIQSGDLAGTVLMLITCLYFKAKWQNPFDKMRTVRKGEFHTFDGKVQPCAMMTKVERMEYVEDEVMQACFLPYQIDGNGPQWKAAVILPKQDGIDAIRGILTKFSERPQVLTKLLTGTGPAAPSSSSSPTGKTSMAASRTHKINLSLPRFSVQVHLDLKPALINLGLGPAFKPSDDFAPISTGPLMISRVTHDLFLEINEEGTEMAAVTVVAMR
jgi:serine protease inhibitor